MADTAQTTTTTETAAAKTEANGALAAVVDPKKPAEGQATDTAAKEPTLQERNRELKEIAQKEQEKLFARRREQARISELEAKVRAAEERDAQRQAQLAEWEDWRKLAATDRVAAFKRLGGEPAALAQDILQSGTPDAKVAELAKELQALRKKDEERSKAYEQQIVEARHREALANARDQLLGAYKAGKDKYPRLEALTDGDPRGVEREYLVTYRMAEADDEARPLLHTFTDAQILEATEARLERLEAKLTARGKGVSSGSEASAGAARQGTESGTSAGSARTISNRDTGDRAPPGDAEIERRKGESLDQWDKRINPILIERAKRGQR